jgi:hypothetical protein
MQDKSSRRSDPRPRFLRARDERADGLVEIATDCGFYVEGTRGASSVAQAGRSRAAFSPIWRAIERGLILGAADVLASFTLYSIAMSPHLLHEIEEPMHPRHRTRPHGNDVSAPLQPDIEDFLLAAVHHHPFLQASAPRGHEAPRRTAETVRAFGDRSSDLLAAAARALRVPALAALMVLAPASSPRAAVKGAIDAGGDMQCSCVIVGIAATRAARACPARPGRVSADMARAPWL